MHDLDTLNRMNKEACVDADEREADKRRLDWLGTHPEALRIFADDDWYGKGTPIRELLDREMARK